MADRGCLEGCNQTTRFRIGAHAWG